MYNYASLKAPENTGGGVADLFLWAPIRAFATIAGPTLTASPGTPVPGEEVTISDAHTFEVGHCFREFLCAPFVNQLLADTVGETGSKKFNPKLELFIPGSYAELHEAMKNMLNEPGIALIKDANCDAGFYYQIGSSCVYAWVAQANYGTANTKGDGRKGYNLVLETAAPSLMLYTGTVTTTPVATP